MCESLPEPSFVPAQQGSHEQQVVWLLRSAQRMATSKHQQRSSKQQAQEHTAVPHTQRAASALNIKAASQGGPRINHPPRSLHWAYTATPGGDHLHPPVVESRASRQTSPRPHRRRLYASDDGRDPASKVASEEWAYWAHKLNGTALLRIAGEATKCRYPVKSGRKTGAPLPACGVHPGGIPPRSPPAPGRVVCGAHAGFYSEVGPAR